jgi:hypothetical protein
MDITSPEHCTPCTQSPKGEQGHPHLQFYVSGPYPGHQIYKCGLCGGRWIRHYGDESERHAWTRFTVAARHATSPAPGFRSASASP